MLLRRKSIRSDWRDSKAVLSQRDKGKKRKLGEGMKQKMTVHTERVGKKKMSISLLKILAIRGIMQYYKPIKKQHHKLLPECVLTPRTSLQLLPVFLILQMHLILVITTRKPFRDPKLLKLVAVLPSIAASRA